MNGKTVTAVLLQHTAEEWKRAARRRSPSDSDARGGSGRMEGWQVPILTKECTRFLFFSSDMNNLTLLLSRENIHFRTGLKQRSDYLAIPSRPRFHPLGRNAQSAPAPRSFVSKMPPSTTRPPPSSCTPLGSALGHRDLPLHPPWS